jgi:hypothetical protein
MSLQTEFTEILSELTRFQSAIGRVHEGLRSQKEREILGDLLSKISQARTDAESAVPAAIQKIHEVAADIQKRAEEQKRKLEELQKQIEQRKAKAAQPPAPPPAKPEVQLDPNLGAQLARELMQHVAAPASAAANKPTQVIKEIWEDWNWENYGKN